MTLHGVSLHAIEPEPNSDPSTLDQVGRHRRSRDASNRSTCVGRQRSSRSRPRVLRVRYVAQIDVDEGEEEFQVQWLGEVFVGAGVSKSPNLARRRVGREHDDRNVGGRRIKAEPFQDFKTIDVGQVHVEEYEFRVTDLGDANAWIPWTDVRS